MNRKRTANAPQMHRLTADSCPAGQINLSVVEISGDTVTLRFDGDKPAWASRAPTVPAAAVKPAKRKRASDSSGSQASDSTATKVRRITKADVVGITVAFDVKAVKGTAELVLVSEESEKVYIVPAPLFIVVTSAGKRLPPAFNVLDFFPVAAMLEEYQGDKELVNVGIHVVIRGRSIPQSPEVKWRISTGPLERGITILSDCLIACKKELSNALSTQQ